METQNQNTQTIRKKRPELLTLLCILTFIGSGLAAFSNLFIFLSFDDVQNIISEYDFNFPEFEMVLSGGKKFFITGFVLYTISLLGAIQMWKLRKIGFHLYTGSQVFILLLPVVSINYYQFPVLGLIVTVAFIIAYASNLKYMY
jgi:hypothetical protein